MIRQAIILLLYAGILGAAVNFFSPNKIPYVGEYRELSNGDEPIVPPSATAGDPPFIAVNVAEDIFKTGNSLFIDARDSAEFACGTIPGSINLPFEYLPVDSVPQYVDSVLGHVPKTQPLVVFCSGEECDLSLHLARNLQAFGYTQISIFFGGSREWEKYGLKLEKRAECAE